MLHRCPSAASRGAFFFVRPVSGMQNAARRTGRRSRPRENRDARARYSRLTETANAMSSRSPPRCWMFTRVGRGHPDVVAQPLAAGEHSTRILADVQVARAVEREVVGRLEVERRIHAGTCVVSNERGAVVAATVWLAQVDGEHPVFARDGDIQDVGATAIVARRRRELDVLRSGSRTRNTPTLINAALQPTQFADNRARTL